MQPADNSAHDFRQELREYYIDVRDYLEVIFRHKRPAAALMIFVFLTISIVSISVEPVYRAEGRVELSLQSPKVTKFEDMASSQLQASEFVQTQLKLFQSASLARRVIDRLQLEEHLLPNAKSASASEAWKKTLREWLQAKVGDGEYDERLFNPDAEAMRRARLAESAFSRKLKVQPEGDTTIVSIFFESTKPGIACDAVNTLIQEFIAWQMDSRIEAASSARRQLEKQLDVARILLENSEEKLNQYAQKAGIVSLEPNLNLLYRQLEETNRAAAEAQTERIGKESLYRQALDGNPSSLPLVMESELIRTLRMKHVDAQAEYEELGITYKDDYPKLKNVKAKVLDIEKQIRNEENRIVDSLRKDYLASFTKEQALLQQADQKRAAALALNDQAAHYKILEREVETNKQIHQSLLQRSREIDANVGTDISNIRIVDHATLPLMPFKPNVRFNLFLATVAGVIGGVGLAFFMEFVDKTIKSIDEFSDRFKIPIFGVLPMVEGNELEQLDCLTTLKPKCSFSEAIRTARVSIQLCRITDRPPRTLLITSTGEGEGKSTIASNLALAFAASEEKVAILDCDLRRPRLHHALSDISDKKGDGLSRFLSGKSERIVPGKVKHASNLHFIPAGPVPDNPTELLASTRMKELLEALSRQFDRIIIDGPPSVGFADVLILGSHADGVVLIGALGETDRDALQIFRRNLENTGAYLLGCIVNKLDITSPSSGYYYKYYKYYKYAYRPARSKPEHQTEDAPSGVGMG
jgi:capsular exopolysaccharide synthesis family protein